MNAFSITHMTLSRTDLNSKRIEDDGDLVSADHLNEVFYIIVHNQNGALVVACAQDFDLPDYGNIASRNAFNEEADAEVYARRLAKANGLSYVGSGGILD